jgi:hypothetical protein
MIYFCCDKFRRNLIAGSASNGIDFLEVLDSEATTNSARQRTLFLHFINGYGPPALLADNVRVEGGERIRGIKVTKITSTSDPKFWEIEVDKYGDFSAYTLRLVQDATHDNPPPGIDPFFASVEFSFKVECPSDFDCKPKRICPPALAPEPELDYLAKDYSSFRQLMLDRMRVLMPQWRERNAADLGIALVELLAYAGDHLSYEQDAIATEAYLGTARRRGSVRRHARLVDYFVHDGCNARTFMHVEVSASPVPLPQGTQLLSRIVQQPPRITPNSAGADEAFRQRPVVFETNHDALLFTGHNDLNFYTWGDDRCCLPQGATHATLADGTTSSSRLRLSVGDILVFEERIGPNTGLQADADPARRHAVRLTRVSPEAIGVLDSSGKEVDRTSAPQLFDPLTNLPVVEIEWAGDDALPFALCISGVSDKQHLAQPLQNISVAHGNIVLADHGKTVRNEPLGQVPDPVVFRPPGAAEDRCSEADRVAVPPRFRPQLQEHPLTHAAPFVFPPPSATAALRPPARELLPSITLNNDAWRAQYDLLGSDADAHEFVVETENDGTAFLRFGDDEHGVRPKSGTIFTARYRVGNGTAGNVGADSLAHIVSNDPGIVSVRNPMPARGGVEPESIEDVRQRAPSAFRTQERAVTEADYAEVTERDPRVQQAAATFRWTGSWHTVFLTIDRFGGLGVDAPFKKAIEAHVDRFRMAGHDLEISAPHFVSLEIEMHVCVKPNYFRSDVKAALADLFSNRVLPGGGRGLFHPDNFSFGQTVYLSTLYAAAQAVPGVASVHITTFKRQGSRDLSPLDAGFLKLGRLEIARLENDRNFAERGVFNVTLGGGK